MCLPAIKLALYGFFEPHPHRRPYSPVSTVTTGKVKCFTHLVTPAGSAAVQNPYPYQGWNGRWVQVVAMTGNQAENSIPVTDTMCRLRDSLDNITI
jgi:hypothetical protein